MSTWLKQTSLYFFSFNAASSSACETALPKSARISSTFVPYERKLAGATSRQSQTSSQWIRGHSPVSEAVTEVAAVEQERVFTGLD